MRDGPVRRTSADVADEHLAPVERGVGAERDVLGAYNPLRLPEQTQHLPCLRVEDDDSRSERREVEQPVGAEA